MRRTNGKLSLLGLGKAPNLYAPHYQRDSHKGFFSRKVDIKLGDLLIGIIYIYVGG